MSILGKQVRDKITGFTGTAISRVEYLTGCAQIGVAPVVDKDGKVQETNYFDHTRIEIVKGGKTFEPSSQDTGGVNRDCPK